MAALVDSVPDTDVMEALFGLGAFEEISLDGDEIDMMSFLKSTDFRDWREKNTFLLNSS